MSFPSGLWTKILFAYLIFLILFTSTTTTTNTVAAGTSTIAANNDNDNKDYTNMDSLLSVAQMIAVLSAMTLCVAWYIHTVKSVGSHAVLFPFLHFSCMITALLSSFLCVAVPHSH